MKKLLIILLFIFYCIFSYSQTIHSYDYIIDMNYYKSYYSKTIKAPSFVIYKLYWNIIIKSYQYPYCNRLKNP